MEKNRRSYARSLAEVAAAEGSRCLKDPNIACVGYGLKFVGGRPQLRAVLQYHVIDKLSSADEIRKRGSEPVPEEVDGYPTDVIPWVIDRPAACPGSKSPTGERGGRKEDPLVGGTSTTVLGDFHSFPTGYGTLGGICFDVGSGGAMALSNAHVYGFDVGNDAIQPWLPTSEYLEATVKYLFCGGPLAHLFFWTAPSPLTSILTTAAAAAWVAAVASDAEDPSRWGQRTGRVPPRGTLTERERVRLEADVPHLPFPGRHWSAKTQWDYARITTAGTTTGSIADDRINEHVLVGKRVFTDRPVYHGGDRVTICAELLSNIDQGATDRFVVAHCVPIQDPDRITRRVLVPDDGRCSKLDHGDWSRVCIRGFTPQVPGMRQMTFPVKEHPFILFSGAGSTFLHEAGRPDNPSGLNALRIPPNVKLVVVCPPSSHVDLMVYHWNEPVRATAISANGTRVDQKQTSGNQGVVQTLELDGPEIVHVELEGGGGEGFLAAICVDKRPVDIDRRKVRRRMYRGQLDLRVSEPPGKWGVVVVAQTLDPTPTGGDPVQAARRLGGIVDSANVVETGECACTILYDAVFDVV